MTIRNVMIAGYIAFGLCWMIVGIIYHIMPFVTFGSSVITGGGIVAASLMRGVK